MSEPKLLCRIEVEAELDIPDSLENLYSRRDTGVLWEIQRVVLHSNWKDQLLLRWQVQMLGSLLKLQRWWLWCLVVELD